MVEVLGPCQLKVKVPVLTGPEGQTGVESCTEGPGRNSAAPLPPAAAPLPGYRSCARTGAAASPRAAASAAANSLLTPSFFKRRAIILFRPRIIVCRTASDPHFVYIPAISVTSTLSPVK